MCSKKGIEKISAAHFHKVLNIYSSCYPYKNANALLAQLGRNNVHGYIADDGFIVYSAVADEAEIIDICVSREARSKGLGFKLLQSALLSLSEGGVKKVYLEFADGNIAASRLYSKAGFVITGRRNNYYKGVDGEFLDAITMIFECQ